MRCDSLLCVLIAPFLVGVGAQKLNELETDMEMDMEMEMEMELFALNNTSTTKEEEEQTRRLRRKLANKSAKLFKPNVHRCVHAVTKLAKQGDGTTVGSCSSCDPAVSEANVPSNCQFLVDNMYYACSKICLPDGYYFDPHSTLSGCFVDNMKQIKINVERCGCSGSFASISPLNFLFVLLLTLVPILAFSFS